jgi:hypothetical protein
LYPWFCCAEVYGTWEKQAWERDWERGQEMQHHEAKVGEEQIELESPVVEVEKNVGVVLLAVSSSIACHNFCRKQSCLDY